MASNDITVKMSLEINDRDVVAIVNKAVMDERMAVVRWLLDIMLPKIAQSIERGDHRK